MAATDRGLVRKSRIAIEIDAGQAFGTGHHATTAGVLTVLDRLIHRRRFERILDLGTGSGVLAIALAKALRRPVLATDIDPVAVRVADENVQRNQVQHAVRTLVASGASHPAIRRAGALRSRRREHPRRAAPTHGAGTCPARGAKRLGRALGRSCRGNASVSPRPTVAQGMRIETVRNFARLGGDRAASPVGPTDFSRRVSAVTSPC